MLLHCEQREREVREREEATEDETAAGEQRLSSLSSLTE